MSCKIFEDLEKIYSHPVLCAVCVGGARRHLYLSPMFYESGYDNSQKIFLLCSLLHFISPALMRL